VLGHGLAVKRFNHDPLLFFVVDVRLLRVVALLIVRDARAVQQSLQLVHLLLLIVRSNQVQTKAHILTVIFCLASLLKELIGVLANFLGERILFRALKTIVIAAVVVAVALLVGFMSALGEGVRPAAVALVLYLNTGYGTRHWLFPGFIQGISA